MKKYWIASMMLVSMFAQNPALARDWNGFYIGANAGAAFNSSSYNLYPTGCFLNNTCGTPPSVNPLRTDSGDFTSTDFTGGGQIGYNYVFNNVFLTGLEADIDYLNVNDTENVNRALKAPLSGRFVHSVNQDFDWYGTVRLKLGAPIACDWLFYATGGYAYGHISSNSNVTFTAGGDTYAGSGSKTRSGWAAGVGTEYSFSDNWSARLEYLYIDLGSFKYGVNGTNALPRRVGATYGTEITTRDNLLRFSVNYQFKNC